MHSQHIAGKVSSDSDKQFLSYRYLKMALKKFASVFWSTLGITGAWDSTANEDISVFFCRIALDD